jgi:glutathione S-transferase
MMKLWSGVLSPFSTKVRIALAEKSLRYDTLEIPWKRETLWGPKPPEFLAVSPRGKVPVLIDGEATVYDSTIIVEYLEDRYPKPPLFPTGAVARARCRQLEDEADTAMVEEVTPLVQELFTQRDEAARNQGRVTAVREALRRRYTTLERELAGREYLCGAFTVADIATFMVVGFASSLGVAAGESEPALTQWFQRMLARPCVAREFEAVTKAAAAV